MNINRMMALFSLVLIWSLSACSEPNELQSELDANKTLWLDSGISNYNLNYRPLCFCQQTNVAVSVVNNEKVAVKITDRDDVLIEDVEMVDFPKYFDVEGFFDLVDSVNGNVPELSVEYHEEFGYPIEVYINYSNTATDSSVRYNIELLPN